MPVFHVIVQKSDGSIIRSDKEKESSAIKSAKMYVNIRKEPAALVINNGRIVFSLPDEAKSDKKFFQSVMAKIKESPTTLSSKPGKPALTSPEINLESFPASKGKPKVDTSTIIPSQRLKNLAKQYDSEVKKGTAVIPQTTRKPDSCTLRILENACLASSLSQGVPMEAAKLICEESLPDIEDLAIKISSGAMALEDALQELVGTECCKTVNKLMEEKEAAKPVFIPKERVEQINRKHRKKLEEIPKTRFREDIGFSSEDDPNDLKYRSIPDGIVIYTTKDVDDKINEKIAVSLGYAPNSWINMHKPADIAGYDYRREVPLTRPSYKHPTWSAFGGRMKNPSQFVAQLEDEFPTDKVKIEIANGVELA